MEDKFPPTRYATHRAAVCLCWAEMQQKSEIKH